MVKVGFREWLVVKVFEYDYLMELGKHHAAKEILAKFDEFQASEKSEESAAEGIVR